MSLDLNMIAGRLEALEETIIQKLIDRVQFKLNPSTYAVGQHHFDEFKDNSLIEIRMQYQQDLEAIFGRFSVPEERPFVQVKTKPKRKFPYQFNDLKIADFDDVNVSSEIWQNYLDFVVEVCVEGDDGHYGSSVECDIYALQAIGTRIHFGAFYVAESKFSQEPVKYQKLIADGDVAAIEAALTRQSVEEKILTRVRRKAEQLQEGINTELRGFLTPEKVVDFYREVIIPLTKKGEVKYLLARHRQ